MTDLQHWLEEIGLAQTPTCLSKDDIDREVLPELTGEWTWKSSVYLWGTEKNY